MMYVESQSLSSETGPYSNVGYNQSSNQFLCIAMPGPVRLVVVHCEVVSPRGDSKQLYESLSRRILVGKRDFLSIRI